MKPKIAVPVVLFVIAISAALYSLQPSAPCPVLLRILSFSFTAFGLYNVVRAHFLAQPYRKQIRIQSWKILANPPQSHRDVVVTIPASEHRKGNAPRFEYLRNGTIDRILPLVEEVSSSGNISIFHAQNSFIPPWREFDIEIRG